MEASGHGGWLERLLAELQFELWIGNAAEIRRQQLRKQKTDRQGTTVAEVAAGKSFSTDLGAGLGEPRSAAVAMASPSHGTGAHRWGSQLILAEDREQYRQNLDGLKAFLEGLQAFNTLETKELLENHP